MLYPGAGYQGEYFPLVQSNLPRIDLCDASAVSLNPVRAAIPLTTARTVDNLNHRRATAEWCP